MTSSTPPPTPWHLRPLLWLLYGYRKLISPVLPAVFGPSCACRFYPSCSQYVVEALQSHGALKGLWLGAKRLLRCTPLSDGGFDPVPSRPRCERVVSSTL